MRSPRTVAAWAWTALIFAACWMPRQLVPEGQGKSSPFAIPHLDKVVHFGMFAGFGLLWAIARPGRARWIAAAGVLAAAATELGQLMPAVGRDAGLDDGLADVAGVAAGLIAAAVLARRHPALRAESPVRAPSARTP